MRPSSDEIDATTAEILDRLVRDHPWQGDWNRVQEQARRPHGRRRMPLVMSAVAAAALITLVMVLSIRTDPHAAAGGRWSDPVNGISIDVEPPFQRASLPLAPASHEILSLSTGPLLIGSRTDSLPTTAARAIGDRGILITIDELEPSADLSPTDTATPSIGFSARPDSFDLPRRAETPVGMPTARVRPLARAGQRVWVIPFTDHDRRLTAIVVAGAAATPSQVDQASRLLDSLRVSPRPIDDQPAAAILRSIDRGRARYVGTVAGHRVYVGVGDDGTVCSLVDGFGLSCSGPAIASERGVVTLKRAETGRWFGVIIPPNDGPVTVNGVPVGEGPQPILVSDLRGDTLTVRQGDTTLADLHWTRDRP